MLQIVPISFILLIFCISCSNAPMAWQCLAETGFMLALHWVNISANYFLPRLLAHSVIDIMEYKCIKL